MRRGFLLAVLALLPGVGPAHGEEPPPAPAPGEVKLAFGFPVGPPLRFVHTLESKSGPAAGTPAAPNAAPAIEKTVVTEFSLELAARRKDGTFEVLLGFGRIRFACAALLPGGVEARSDRPLPREAPARAAALPDLVPGGTTTEILLDAEGVCRGATEDSLEHRARTKTLGLDAEEAKSLPVHLAGRRLLREYARLVAALPVPAEALAVGRSFGIATPIGPGEGRGGFYASQTLTVTAIDADAVVVEGKGRVAWADDEKARKAGEALPTVKVLRSEVSSKFRIARADGLPLGGSWEFAWASEERAAGDDAFYRREGREKATLKRVAAWPSGGK